VQKDHSGVIALSLHHPLGWMPQACRNRGLSVPKCSCKRQQPCISGDICLGIDDQNLISLSFTLHAHFNTESSYTLSGPSSSPMQSELTDGQADFAGIYISVAS
jgi:hypothetical protein